MLIVRPREDLPRHARTGTNSLSASRRTARCRRLLVVPLLALGGLTAAAAADVYRWVDDEGRVQFSDRAPDGAAETIDVAPAPPSGDNSGLRHRSNQRRLDAYAADRAEKKAARLKAEAAARVAKENCERAKRNKFRFDHAPRVARRDADGNYHVLDGDEYEAARARHEEIVKRWCERRQ